MRLRLSLLITMLLCHCIYPSDKTETGIIEQESSQQDHPKLRKKDDRLLSLKNIILDQSQQTLAIASYPLSKSKNSTTWDELNKFGQVLDQRFFKETSRKTIGGGIVAACFGAIVPHPSCGYILYKTGNFLNVPISSIESSLFITWVVVTTTPAFAQQSFDIGERVISFIFHEKHFDARKQEEDSRPHLFRKNKLHQLANIVLFGSATINAAIPTILMREAEKNFPVFVAATFFPFYVAWAENYFMSGYRGIHHLFEFYQYTPRSNYQKREILKKKIRDFQEGIRKDDVLTSNIFKAIHSQKKRDFSNEDGDLFAFSTLFLRNIARMSGDEEDGDITEAFLMNFKLDVDTHPSSFSDDIFSWASTFLTGAGIYTRYCINQSVLDGLFIEFGMPTQAATITSTSLAAFEAAYRVLTSQYVQKEYFKTFKDIFALKGSLPFLRKGLGVLSFTNGALFSLPHLIAGMTVFKDYPLTSKIAYLAPAFLLDHVYHDAFFNSNYNKFITSISKNKIFKNKSLRILSQRACLNSYARKASDLIDQFDVETIEKLYTTLQKGL